MSKKQRSALWSAAGVVLVAMALLGWLTNRHQAEYYNVDARVGVMCEDGTEGIGEYRSFCDRHGGLKGFVNRVPLASGGTTEIVVTAPAWAQHGGFGELFAEAPWLYGLGGILCFAMVGRSGGVSNHVQ